MSDDKIIIVPATHAPDGSPLEPEERPAMVRTETQSPLALGGVETGAGVATFIDHETTAGVLAETYRNRCATCMHFSIPAWRNLRRRLDTSSNMDHRKFVNEVRAAVEQMLPENERERHVDPQTGDLDLEHALDSFGLCGAITEILSAEQKELTPALQLPEGGCPENNSPGGTFLGALYQPRDVAADRAASQAYDKILRMAEGHKQ